MMEQIANVSLKAPVNLALEMRVEAAKLGMSRSAAIRDAMRLWLAVNARGAESKRMDGRPRDSADG